MEERFNIVLNMGMERQALKNGTVVCTLENSQFLSRFSLLHTFPGLLAVRIQYHCYKVSNTGIHSTFSVQRKSKRRLIRWSAHTGYQPLMTAPKCHTLMQSSTRFRDFQILYLLECHTEWPKIPCSEGTCSPRWDQLWFLIDTPWVSSTLLITNLTLCFPCILFYLGTDFFIWESG